MRPRGVLDAVQRRRPAGGAAGVHRRPARRRPSSTPPRCGWATTWPSPCWPPWPGRRPSGPAPASPSPGRRRSSRGRRAAGRGAVRRSCVPTGSPRCPQLRPESDPADAARAHRAGPQRAGPGPVGGGRVLPGTWRPRARRRPARRVGAGHERRGARPHDHRPDAALRARRCCTSRYGTEPTECPASPESWTNRPKAGEASLLVDALATRWGSFVPHGGKIVWATVRVQAARWNGQQHRCTCVNDGTA